MNRLQKKCVMGTVGVHLLLFVILIVGPAFFNRQPKPDDNQVLDVIPANLVDAAVNSGVQDAQPPPPQPVAVPQPPPPQPQPLQMPPLPPRTVQPPDPTPPPVQPPTPEPSFLTRVKEYFATPPTPTITPDTTPVRKPEKPKPDIQINTQLVKRSAPTQTAQTSQADHSQNTKAINNTLRSLKSSLSSATKVDVSGNNSVAFANYATVVRSVYEQALRSHLPGSVANNNENTKVSITVTSDGTVTSAHIISPSGDSAWDGAVQSTLDQVSFIAPFPEGATEKERHYTLSFNPDVEKSFE